MTDRRLPVVDPTEAVVRGTRRLEAGETVDITVGEPAEMVEVSEAIPSGHELALADIWFGVTASRRGMSVGPST